MQDGGYARMPDAGDMLLLHSFSKFEMTDCVLGSWMTTILEQVCVLLLACHEYSFMRDLIFNFTWRYLNVFM